MLNQLLIVEDDARVADFLERGLRAEGYAVSLARTGPEGLAAARQGEWALIVLDVMLPGCSGMDVLQTLRSEGQQTPVLMLTAMDSVEDKVGGLRLGADDYLTKPFAFDELVARLEALRRRGRTVQQVNSVLALADLRLDRERMRVTRGDQPIVLTAKELAFLELLMSAPGRVFSRERILSNVWGANEDPLTNVVDVYVRRLRQKIDEGRELALLKTVRGIGYKIDAEPD
ncbi:response regulator transcription factor [Paucibacter sp. Y2R2-4]|uniref:response regulator transcription factor n=1 Tax=Paucibacter sp. Y2R2-4 TaxID=2893553 RepID=UPI0021E49474|nr:response regulator transcription factor [Paucibacter sp. Y2R2-4]MCV2349791.1 response regulator transcription factor [Paucibacter sp. Y2R2-4]